MSEHNYIACDGCMATRQVSAPQVIRKTWSTVTIECDVKLSPEIKAGKSRPGDGYQYVSGLERHFCPKCTERLVVPILSLTLDTRLPAEVEHG